MIPLLALSQCAPVGKAVPKVCEVHRIALEEKHGYGPDPGIMADPNWNYTRYASEAEHRHPHATPWYFGNSPHENWSDRRTVKVCPDCDRELKRSYAEYNKLSPAAKDSRWQRHLAAEVEREKKVGTDQR
ncbi:hypothetical protein OJ996_23105 [Luteolibacter sp. GHJ8]|uniref:HNH endonuclease n=1 Tax=Luteolibacter rhizosphaerae TaxID=2989719 RepID=A0ABT3G9H9_9BACT|nr:hypothetical protein [Luteolibacter rhizosphaerae]MCW1916495.1 hypothetical protein [Luteolibacter rhizosphaerae]